MNQFEKLIEYIINDDEAKAKALFHQIVIQKSRTIYEGLVDEDQFDPRQAQANIQGDQEGMHEADDEFGGDESGIESDELGGDDLGDDLGGDDMGGDDMGGEASVEDRVMDLEDAIDELKAEFESLMGGEGDDMGGDDLGGDDMGGDDFDSDDDMGGDDFDSDESGDELGDEAGIDDQASKFGEASIYGESKSPTELMREYVEKITSSGFNTNQPSEGDPVGSGGTKSPINSKSNVISGKNDMGGTTANIAKGGTASDKDSNTGPKKPSNAYTKGETKMGQDKYENSPAANTKGYKDKRTVNRTKEGATTDGSVPVVKKSFNPGGTPGFKG